MRKALGLVVGAGLAVFAGLPLGCEGMDPATRSVLSAEEMQREIEGVLAIPNLSERFIALGAVLSGLTTENAPGAGVAYSENLIVVRACEMRPFANAWGRLDPLVEDELHARGGAVGGSGGLGAHGYLRGEVPAA